MIAYNPPRNILRKVDVQTFQTEEKGLDGSVVLNLDNIILDPVANVTELIVIVQSAGHAR